MEEVLRLLTAHGVPFVVLNVFLEQLGLPIPAVPTLVVAGALAREGKLPALALVLLPVLAAVVADLAWFLFGRRHGGTALRLICKLSLSPDSCVRQTESLFTRLGLGALVVAKFVPGLSTVAPPLAGASGMGIGAFLLLDGAGALLWAGSALALGALFSKQVSEVLAALESLGSGAAAVLVAALVLYVLARAWERRRFAREFTMTRIAPDELAARLAAGDPPSLWDVRSAAARARDGRSIPGARLLRMEAILEDFAGHPLDREIVLYCT